MGQTTVKITVQKEVLRRHHQGKETREKGPKRAAEVQKEGGTSTAVKEGEEVQEEEEGLRKKK